MNNRENLPGAYVTSVHYPESKTVDDLPSKEEYIKNHKKAENFDGCKKWSEPKYLCTECGGYMRKKLSIVLQSYPSKYIYRCDNCGREEYLEV